MFFLSPPHTLVEFRSLSRNRCSIRRARIFAPETNRSYSTTMRQRGRTFQYFLDNFHGAKDNSFSGRWSAKSIRLVASSSWGTPTKGYRMTRGILRHLNPFRTALEGSAFARGIARFAAHSSLDRRFEHVSHASESSTTCRLHAGNV